MRKSGVALKFCGQNNIFCVGFIGAVGSDGCIVEFLVCLSRILSSASVIWSWFLATKKLSTNGHCGIRIDRTPSLSFSSIPFLSHDYLSGLFGLPD